MLVGLASFPATAQQGQVLLLSPRSGESFDAGEQVVANGRVIQFGGFPLGGVTVWLRLLDSQGRGIPVLDARVSSSSFDGFFAFTFDLPADLVAGTYTLLADAESVEIFDAQIPITVRTPFRGVPILATLSFALGGALAAVGVVVFLRRIGRARSSGRPPSA